MDTHFISSLVKKAGVSDFFANIADCFILSLIILIVIYVTARISKKYLNSFFHNLSQRTKTQFDNYLVKNRGIEHLSKIVPYIIFSYQYKYIFSSYPDLLHFIKLALDVYIVILIIQIMKSILMSVKDLLKTKDNFKDKPLNSFIQLCMMFMYIAGGLVVFSIVTGKSVVAFLTAMGAMSAILILVFKDVILGFIASIQVSVNDMVRIGDWISMDKYGADGEVIEINLATVKVQNWDKTITTIPTYNLVSDSFKNWRGMEKAGGRRIKRALYLKISSIKHLDEVKIKELSSIPLIKDYLNDKSKEIKEFNDKNGYNVNLPLNGRKLTNIGVFRKYMEEYISANPDIHKDMTLMVRQLEPTITGIAIEVYAFSNKTAWATYEGIMADIFDHLLAAVNTFDLEVYEHPTSGDIRELAVLS